MFGPRRRGRIACPTFQKTILFGDVASLCLCFSQDPLFIHFFGAAAATASNIAPKRVALLTRVGTFFPNLVPLGATGAQNDAPGP